MRRCVGAGTPSTSEVRKTDFNQNHQNPNAPPLAKIGHQPSHGRDSTSSDAIPTMKCSHQRITYPIGSAMMRAFFVNFCFRCKNASSTQNMLIDDDDNYIIYAAAY